MAFWFQCPICQSKRLATEGIIGRRVRCADCSNFVEVSRPAADSHVDQDEMDQLVDKLITEDEIVSDEEVGIEHPSSVASKRRFREGSETDQPDVENDADIDDADIDDADDDFNALDTQSSEMDIKPLKPSRPVASEETEFAASGEFSLSPPSDEIVEVDDVVEVDQIVEVEVMGAGKAVAAGALAAVSGGAKAKKNLEWKTVPTEEDPDFVDPPLLGDRKKREETEMDMTPMVDVTFLLLIFFMVTASFVMQKSMNRPTETVDDPSTEVVIDTEDSQDIIQIDIAADNTYYVTLPEEEQIEAPSEQDLRIALRGAGDGGSTGIIPSKMLIRAHEESFHGRVITAMDIGTELGLALQVQITAEDL